MRSVFLTGLVLTLFLRLPLSVEGREEPDRIEAKAEALAALLEPIREQHGLPALAGAIVTPEGPVAVGAVGLRRSGNGPPVTINDRFHLGSCTKAMTATLLATFVEEGVISWQTTLAEALPEFARVMHPDYRSATIEQVLAHRAGFSGETAAPGLSLGAMRASRASLTRQRTDYLRRVLAEAPSSRPGTTYEYSNRGYIVAGAIAERLGRAPWEVLMRRRLFEPLGMSSSGFGPMASPGQVDQPWPHVVQNGRTVPIAPGPGADNPLLLGPAGTVHASLGDWARFVACHLRAGEEGPALLTPQTFATLHAKPAEGNYAFGWGFHERSWGDGTVLNHAGSNTMNYAVVWMAPNRRFAVLAATNQAGDAGPKACDEVSSALIELYRSTNSPDNPRRPRDGE
ncbi:serine hydrolase domain-containing protein [Tautonia rosea]|uniref:serine hydrolase domain-containing protein n=1 Tax=Tautonia rosea TaxID=2728037 RepID=UPI001476556B|nr:serine hydrolase domain-containing protein [Tautonia rosea]